MFILEKNGKELPIRVGNEVMAITVCYALSAIYHGDFTYKLMKPYIKEGYVIEDNENDIYYLAGHHKSVDVEQALEAYKNSKQEKIDNLERMLFNLDTLNFKEVERIEAICLFLARKGGSVEVLANTIIKKAIVIHDKDIYITEDIRNMFMFMKECLSEQEA